MNKDWMDALREKSLAEGVPPSPASWEAVGRRVRRAAAIRRAGIAAVAAVPVAALLLWVPWHRPAQRVPSGPAVTQVAQEPDTTVAPAPVVPEVAPAAPARANEKPRSHKLTLSAGGARLAAAEPAVSEPAVSVPAGPDLPDDASVVIGNGTPDPSPAVAPAPAVIPDKAPVILSDSEESAPDEPFDESVFLEDARPRRARISVGFRGGADMTHRQANVGAEKYPNLVAMNIANTLDPRMLEYAKSNSAGDLYGYFLDNGLINYHTDNAFGASHFRHDLPITLGLSVRADLTPRIGLESGLEYSYLHSVESLGVQTLDQRLHFIGIPVRADVRLWTADRFSLYAGLGAKVEKCVYAVLGKVQSDEKKFQWSSEVFAGAQYRLGPRVQLYFQPELSCYFTRTDLPTSRTENPLSFSLHAGLRFEL